MIEKIRDGVDAGEIFFIRREEKSVRIKDGKNYKVESTQYRGAGLRAVKNGRLGFSCTGNMNDMEGLLKRALETSRFGEEV